MHDPWCTEAGEKSRDLERMQFAFEGLYFDGVGMPQRVCRFPGLLLPTHAAVTAWVACLSITARSLPSPSKTRS